MTLLTLSNHLTRKRRRYDGTAACTKNHPVRVRMIFGSDHGPHGVAAIRATIFAEDGGPHLYRSSRRRARGSGHRVRRRIDPRRMPRVALMTWWRPVLPDLSAIPRRVHEVFHRVEVPRKRPRRMGPHLARRSIREVRPTGPVARPPNTNIPSRRSPLIFVSSDRTAFAAVV